MVDLVPFLEDKGTSLADVVRFANARLPLRADDVLLAVGSLVEGLASDKSDLDLLLLTRRDGSELPEDGNIGWTAGRCLVDMRVVEWSRIDDLVGRLKHWTGRAWNVTRAPKFTIDERTLLHRLWSGVRLEWDDGEVPPHPHPEAHELERLKLHVARQDARTIQVDMSGLHSAGDHRSLAFAAFQLMGNALDGLLASQGLTNPLLKWRSRLLERVPDAWGARAGLSDGSRPVGEVVWDRMRFPAHADAAAVERYAYGCAAFARAAFAAAEYEAFALAARPADAPVPEQAAGARPLAFDVDFALSEESVRLARLNEFGRPLEMTHARFRDLLRSDLARFDGRMDPAKADRAGTPAEPWPAVAEAGLLASPFTLADATG